jgi:hypothetical protein
MIKNIFEIKEIDIKCLSIPFKEESTSTWSKTNGATIFLVRIKTKDNIEGYGEVPCFFPSDILNLTLKRIANDLIGRDIREINKLFNRSMYGGSWLRTGQSNDLGSAAWAAFETALYNNLSYRVNSSLESFFGGFLNNKFKLTAIIDATDDFKLMCEKAKKLVKEGYCSLFIKLAKQNKNLDEDFEIVKKISKEVGSKVDLHLDINGAWSITSALKALNFFQQSNFNISCIEQPVMDISQIKILKNKSKFPIGINDSLNSLETIIQCAKNEIADIFVLDIFECGGIKNLWIASSVIHKLGMQVVCRSHRSAYLSYITSLKVIGAASSNILSSSNQYYIYKKEDSYLDWKPNIDKGYLQIPNNFNLSFDHKKINNFHKIYESGSVFEVYKNKDKEVVPNFPKY